MNRREFLRTAGLLGGAAMVGGPTLLRSGDLWSPADSVLNMPAAECPVDTVVVLMMENRSFDHYFGYLGTDEPYLDEGRRRYGKDFSIKGRTAVTYKDEFGADVKPRPVRKLGN